MGLQHREFDLRSAISPESILTGEGKKLLQNLVDLRGLPAKDAKGIFSQRTTNATERHKIKH